MDLAVLRTAKAALDEGLIDADDFQAVKGSFVKAQSIKAGLDAGFITESDFAEARQEFFRSMGIASSFTGAVPPAASPKPALTPRTVVPSQPAATTVRSNSPVPAAAPAPSTSAGAKKVTPLNLNVDEPPAAAPELNSARGPSSPVPESLVETPTSVPDHGGAQATAGKASMSGITVHPNSVNIVGEMRIRKKYRWIVFKIGQTGKQVEVDKCGGPKSTFEEFASFMPENECRYGVYDYEYQNSEGTIYGKLVFISWAPEVASTKAKMQHASTKDFFRGFLDGISVEVHATEPSELDEEVVRERVSNTVARK